ncbi:MAG: 5-oxoprolinase subunit PxpB [Pseudomonadota bacterium]
MEYKNARFYLLGEHAAVLESFPPASWECQQKIGWIASKLTNHPFVTEVVPGMNSLTVLLNNECADPDSFLEKLKEFWQSDPSFLSLSSRTITIPVEYEGQDLERVANHTGLEIDQVIALHIQAEYRVYFLGFQPGFAYMGGLPLTLATPRLAEPRLSVPAGSVGIGGNQTGIYPFATPGGWNIIGRTAIKLFDPYQTPPTLLQPGDLVRFVPMAEHK